jgi:hypothetical protein
MLTTKDIMESCWEADSPYSDVVMDCKNMGLRIPSAEEYQAYCEMQNSAIQDWYDSEGNCSETCAFDAGGHLYADRIDFDAYKDER